MSTLAWVWIVGFPFALALQVVAFGWPYDRLGKVSCTMVALAWPFVLSAMVALAGGMVLYYLFDRDREWE